MKFTDYRKSIDIVFNHPLNKFYKLKTFYRLCWWKFNQHFLKLPVIVNLAKDVRYICFPDSSYGGLIFYMKWPDYYEMLFTTKVITKDDVFIDVGAHMGDYSLLASSVIKSGKIYSFEPDGNVLPQLYENIRLNNLDDLVRVFEGIVSDKNGYEYLKSDHFSELSHIRHDSESKTGLYKKIPSVSLDRYIEENKIEKVKMIKIDVEGAELKVLKGMKNIVKNKNVKYILFEINKNCIEYGNTPQDTLNFLTQHGYRVYSLKFGKLKLVKNVDFANNKVINLLAVTGTLPKIKLNEKI